jgi:hypothetical protein
VIRASTTSFAASACRRKARLARSDWFSRQGNFLRKRQLKDNDLADANPTDFSDSELCRMVRNPLSGVLFKLASSAQIGLRIKSQLSWK